MGEQQEGEKKSEEVKKGDGGSAITVVLKLDMHCEGCAKKIRRSLKNFDGVENVKTDCGGNKLTVIGNVDPAKIKERVEEKTRKKVELVSPQPNKAAKEGGGGGGGGGDKKSDEKKSEEGKSDDKKAEDKKEKTNEPQVATVILKTRVHCDGCAQKMKKIIGKYEGVQDVNVDLQKDLITIKGTMNMKDLLPYLNVKLKRTVELAPTKKDDGAGGDKKPKEGGGGGGGGGGSEKPKEGGGGGGSEKAKEGGGDGSEKPKEGSGGSSEKPKEGGGEKKDGAKPPEGSSSQENTTRIEVNKMEHNPYGYGYGYANYAYDPRQHGEGYGYSYAYDPRQQPREGYGHQVVEYWHAPEYTQPPQMFSDENPNACSIM